MSGKQGGSYFRGILIRNINVTDSILFSQPCWLIFARGAHLRYTGSRVLEVVRLLRGRSRDKCSDYNKKYKIQTLEKLCSLTSLKGVALPCCIGSVRIEHFLWHGDGLAMRDPWRDHFLADVSDMRTVCTVCVLLVGTV